MSEKCKHHFSAADIAEAEETGAHPWNPDSLMHGTHLSRLAGLARVGISRIALPPGKESFVYHLHHYEEEWVYVLSGNGEADINDETVAIGQGSFLAFPTDPPVAHLLRNTGDEPLVCLMGGENREFEVADYPRHNKRMLRRGTTVEIYALDGATEFSGN